MGKLLTILRFVLKLGKTMRPESPPVNATPDPAANPLPPQKPDNEAPMPLKPNPTPAPHITLDGLLMRRVDVAELSPAMSGNAHALVSRVNALLAAYSGIVAVSSGYRPPDVNRAVGGAALSWHQQCAAVDLVDVDGKLWAYCLNNLELCADLGLWLEDKRWTPTWIHLQIYPPKSGNRIFVPNNKPPAAPRAWNGVYDKRLNSKNKV